MTKRVYQNQLLGLDLNGSPCEVCFSHMHAHEWADMDDNGFVVACSNQAEGLSEVFVFIEVTDDLGE